MKKAKVILTSLVVLAIVRGALAFKAKNPNFCLYQTRVVNQVTTCATIGIIEPTKVGSAFPSATTWPIDDCPPVLPLKKCNKTFAIKIDD